MKKTITFDDVLLEPQFSDIRSRSKVDISSKLTEDILLTLPIISAPMNTVTESHMAIAMANAGGLGIIHRYNSIEGQVSIVSAVVSAVDTPVGAAIGTTGDFMDRATALYDAGARILCVDIAHGHHILMKEALLELRREFYNSVHIVAGNVATLKAFNDLADWGADSIKVGVGGGSICSTRILTGHGVPTLQSVLDCSRSDRDAKLIADGGIKNSGDMVKALAMGADFVMSGSLLAGTTETPGESFLKNGVRYKVYQGMASKEAQITWKGTYASIEGVTHSVPFRGSVKPVLRDLENGIRSGFSYSGALNLRELQTKAQFVKQTSAGHYESNTHIVERVK